MDIKKKEETANIFSSIALKKKKWNGKLHG